MPRPSLARSGPAEIRADHHELGTFLLRVGPDPDGGEVPLLFTENETNRERLFRVPNRTPFVKDAFHRHVVNGRAGVVNPAETGTKAAAHYARTIPAGGMAQLVEAYRQALFWNRCPDLGLLIWPTAAALIALVAGAVLFRRLAPTLSDHL